MIKYYKLIIKTFDQLKNDNFDQLKFDQVIVSLKDACHCRKKSSEDSKDNHFVITNGLQKCKPNTWISK